MICAHGHTTTTPDEDAAVISGLTFETSSGKSSGLDEGGAVIAPHPAIFLQGISNRIANPEQFCLHTIGIFVLKAGSETARLL